jgi:type I restriction enzyme S subunit
MMRYDKYKDSGVEWIGEIPEQWNLKKLKYEATIQGGYAFKSAEFVEDGKPIVRIGDVAPKIDLDNCQRTSENNIPQEFKLKKNDTLVALSGATVGKMCFIDEDMDAYVNQRVARVTNGTKWLHHILDSEFFIEQIVLTAGGSAQDNISTNDIANFQIPIPTKTEQIAIANFLDEKTAKIDKLIANKQKLIELLKEERTAIINQAVTRGIDPNVKLKPSGIDWLGDIPAHWEVKKLKYVAQINSPRKNDNFSKDSDEEIIFLPMEKVSEDGTIMQDTRKKVSEVSTGFTYFEKGDVIVAKITPCFENGKGALLANLETNFGFGSTEFHTLRALKDIVKNQFLFYLIKSERFMTIGEAFMTGSAGQKRVPTDFLKEFIAPIPPLNEQSQIIQQIEVEMKRIDGTLSKIEKEIELLQEYRTALISETVTGKIKVI